MAKIVERVKTTKFTLNYADYDIMDIKRILCKKINFKFEIILCDMHLNPLVYTLTMHKTKN